MAKQSWMKQTSQLSRFGRETHNFSTDLTTACQSHDLAETLLISAICVSRDPHM